ncbi:hypothetical protein BS78_05G022200 [Paspalum vaginatum]|nr:hypothetical protein BS78_05G022200 [Paspalum vaginatum]
MHAVAASCAGFICCTRRQSLVHHCRTGGCYNVESHVVGAPCGVMDQMTTTHGEANKLLAMVHQYCCNDESIPKCSKEWTNFAPGDCQLHAPCLWSCLHNLGHIMRWCLAD